MSIVNEFQDIARRELTRHRGRLGQLTPEQERAVESLLISTVNKISHPLVQQIERSFEIVETELVKTWPTNPGTSKEEQSSVRQFIEPILDES
jgi:glutamyl-tRNA reductase